MAAIGAGLEGKVRDLIARQIAAGRQLGVQVCAYRYGERILDLWAGQMGPNDPRPVQADTLFSSFSTTKGVAATALHILADRGLIDVDAPVARYWPEFAANGKEGITVALAMSHQAGLHAMPRPATVEFLIDWDAGLRWVANGTPAWPPGTATGYHAITFAWIVGGIVGAARLATLKTPQPGAGAGAVRIPEDHDFFKAMPPELPASIYNEMRVRKACLPSANGHFTARALAKMYAALANGGIVEGVQLVSRGRIAAMQRVLTDARDRVLGLPIPKGVGFMMGGTWAGNGGVSVFGPRRSAFGHSGAGGSTAFADPDTGLAVAVTLNQMQTTLQAEGPTWEICQLIRQELGVA